MWQSEMMQRAKRRWGIGRGRGEMLVWISQATISHLLKVDLCSRLNHSEKEQILFVHGFYIRNTPSVLRSWRSLVCILLRVELVRIFRLKFKTEAPWSLSRGLHLRWSVLTFQPLFWFLKSFVEELEWSSFHTKSGLHILETMILPEYCLPSKYNNNQGGIRV